MSDPLERGHVEEARREKRARIEALGVSAFAYGYRRTHLAVAALAEWHDDMGDAGR